MIEAMSPLWKEVLTKAEFLEEFFFFFIKFGFSSNLLLSVSFLFTEGDSRLLCKNQIDIYILIILLNNSIFYCN